MGVWEDFFKRPRNSKGGIGETPETTSVVSQDGLRGIRVDVPSPKQKRDAILNAMRCAEMGRFSRDYASPVKLTETEISICQAMGSLINCERLDTATIERLGGKIDIFEYVKKQLEAQAKRSGYTVDSAHQFCGTETVMGYIDQKEKDKLRGELTPSREEKLGDLYKVALGITNNTFDLEDLLLGQVNLNRKNANKSRITVGSENSEVEQVDLSAAITLARLVKCGGIDEKMLNTVGGPAALIHRISGNAKVSAMEFQVRRDLIPVEAKGYIDVHKSFEELKKERSPELGR